MLGPVEFGDYAIRLVLSPQLLIGRIEENRSDMRAHVDREEAGKQNQYVLLKWWT